MKSYCLSLDDDAARWLDNHVRGTGGTVTAIFRNHIAELKAINEAEILARSRLRRVPDSPAAVGRTAAPGSPIPSGEVMPAASDSPRPVATPHMAAGTPSTSEAH